ncbi:MAG: hypothetical protein MUF04_01785 [Akkermansiaceae bacterium]|jgi:hypothetical protein|nr:hypothetical protein [Akkermansiaceae bacterium]
MDSCGALVGWLVIFDGRLERTWDERITWRTTPRRQPHDPHRRRVTIDRKATRQWLKETDFEVIAVGTALTRRVSSFSKKIRGVRLAKVKNRLRLAPPLVPLDGRKRKIQPQPPHLRAVAKVPGRLAKALAFHPPHLLPRTLHQTFAPHSHQPQSATSLKGIPTNHQHR